MPAPTERKKPLAPDVQLTCVRFAPCGTVLAAAAHDGTVRRWDVAHDFAELPPISGFDGWASDLAFHPDKKRLFAVDSWGRLACWTYPGAPATVWDVPAAHDGWARKVAVRPDGAAVATCGKDGFARVWAADSGKKLAELAAGDDLLSLAWHPSGSHLVAGTLHGEIRTWDAATGKPGQSFDLKETFLVDRIQDVGGVRCLLFAADGKTLFAGGAKPKTGGFVQATPVIAGFDRATGKRLHAWTGASDNEGFVHDLRWHPAGPLIAVTSGQPGNGKVFFWTPGDAKPSFEAAKPNCHSADISPDGKTLVVAATNAGSSGNGRVKSKAGEYPGNTSPVHVWNLGERPG